jgi:hypothetical protein
VKEAFNYDEEFLQFCTDSYIVLAGMHCMDIAEILLKVVLNTVSLALTLFINVNNNKAKGLQ